MKGVLEDIRRFGYSFMSGKIQFSQTNASAQQDGSPRNFLKSFENAKSINANHCSCPILKLRSHPVSVLNSFNLSVFDPARAARWPYHEPNRHRAHAGLVSGT